MGKVINILNQSKLETDTCYIYQHCDLEFIFACKQNIQNNKNMPKYFKDICSDL